MIIDIHCHFREENKPSKYYWDNLVVKTGVSFSGSSEEAVRERSRQSCDRTGDLLVKDMDEAGVDKAVLLIIDAGFMVGTGQTETLEEVHGIFANAVRRHPDRLMFFAGIDPRRPEAVQFIERAVREWNIKGIKLHPAVGFYPNERYCYPLYEKAQQLGLPILCHTGPEAIPFYSKYAMPIFLDEVANDFPGLKIIMAHAGGCYWEEAAEIASYKPNIYLDLSWWQSRVLRDAVERFYKPLRMIIDTAGRQKVMFGSDWPGMRLIRKLPHAAWVKLFKDLAKNPPEEVKAAGVSFSDAEVEGILGGNAARILGL